MTELELAYLAGFFDGEGCIGIYQNGNTKGYFLSVQITQNDSATSRPMLEQLRDLWGGSISGRTHQSTGNRRLGYTLTGDRAAVLLDALLPYLVGKREQALVAVAWQRNRSSVTRDARGRVVPRSDDERAYDASAAEVVRLLKSQTLEHVMEDQKDLVRPLHTLSQILNYKGV